MVEILHIRDGVIVHYDAEFSGAAEADSGRSRV